MERTNEKLYQRIKNEIMHENVYGTRAGQWSARKSQYLVRKYKEEGGGYKGEKDKNSSLTKWSNQQWMTKSGKPSSETGERYLPKKAIESLSNAEYNKTSKLKREAMKEGKQYSKQPEKIAEKTKMYR